MYALYRLHSSQCIQCMGGFRHAPCINNAAMGGVRHAPCINNVAMGGVRHALCINNACNGRGQTCPMYKQCSNGRGQTCPMYKLGFYFCDTFGSVLCSTCLMSGAVDILISLASSQLNIFQQKFLLLEELSPGDVDENETADSSRANGK